jgi:hypothetical protein
VGNLTLPSDFNRLPAEALADLQQALEATLATNPTPAGEQEKLITTSGLPLPAQAPRLVGVVGKPRVGKDVIAQHCERRYRGVVRCASSDCIIAEVNQLLAPTPHRIGEQNKSDPHYRHLLQAWGNAREQLDPYYWADQMERRINALWSAGARLVFYTGVRTPEAVALIRRLGGKLWKAHRPGVTYQAEHASEQKLDHLTDADFDAIIINPVEGDLEPYLANIERALKGETSVAR